MGGEAAPRTLIGASEIAARVEALAQEVVAAFGPAFVMVVVLKGAFVFAADLVRAIGRQGGHPRVEFLQLSSYGSARESSGTVRVVGPVPSVAGQRVLVVDDVLDTGRSAATAVETMRRAGAEEVRVCVLLDKPARRAVELRAHHIGFTVPDSFVVGYGIDCGERWRELPDIAAVD